MLVWIRVTFFQKRFSLFFKLGSNERWLYGSIQMNVANTYKYLGLYFSTRLSLHASEDLILLVKPTKQLTAKAKCHEGSSVRLVLSINKNGWWAQIHIFISLSVSHTHTKYLQGFLSHSSAPYVVKCRGGGVDAAFSGLSIYSLYRYR